MRSSFVHRTTGAGAVLQRIGDGCGAVTGGRVHDFPFVGGDDLVEVELAAVDLAAAGMAPARDHDRACLRQARRFQAEPELAQIVRVVGLSSGPKPHRLADGGGGHPRPVIGDPHPRIGAVGGDRDVDPFGAGADAVVDQVGHGVDEVVPQVAEADQQPGGAGNDFLATSFGHHGVITEDG